MIRKIGISFIVIILFCCSQKPKIKIACVGDSITYGAGIIDRERNSYPSQLQNLLGEKYIVKNFGRGGATLLKKGNIPYWKTEQYKQALSSNPDMVYIKLGTNDSKEINRKHYQYFVSDYKELILSFQKLPSRPKVVLLLPIPSFLKDSNSIYDPIIKNQIIPMIQDVSYQMNIPIIDLYHSFVDKENMIPDKIHPNSFGADIIAKRIYEDIIQTKQENKNELKKISFPNAKKNNFYGFTMYDFVFDGNPAKIVFPKTPLKDMPWVWHSRFWPQQPQTDIALLERGFFLVYCSVEGLLGSPKAVNIWNDFYSFLIEKGFYKKAILEAMSRGGFIAYHWAIENPEKVACIYAHTPALDGSIEENTRALEEKIKSLSGNIKVIYKKNQGHHPHSSKNPKPIVDFILANIGRKINFSLIPTPSPEYRNISAGWGQNKWIDQHKRINYLCDSIKKPDIFFIGNSITQGWGDSCRGVWGAGDRIAKKYFENMQIINAGISGDRVEHILWRISNMYFDSEFKPKNIILTVGVNNFQSNTAEEIAQGIIHLNNKISVKFPLSKLILLGPLPAGLEHRSTIREKYNTIHQILKNTPLKNTIYYNCIYDFTDSKNNLQKNYYADDGIHLQEKGYQKWAELILKLIQ